MLKNFILGTELCKAGGFTINNIAFTIKNYPLIEGTDYMKYGGITLFNTESLEFPKYLTELMTAKDANFSNLENYLPWTFLVDMCEGQTKLIDKSLKRIKIDGKQFVEVLDEKLSKVILNDQITKSVVDNDEIKDLVNEGFILGYINYQIKKH